MKCVTKITVTGEDVARWLVQSGVLSSIAGTIVTVVKDEQGATAFEVTKVEETNQ